MNRLITGIFIMATLLCALSPARTLAVDTGVPTITLDDARALLGTPDVVFIDGRSDVHWKPSSSKIAGAVREDPKAADRWFAAYQRDKTLIVYCDCKAEELSGMVTGRLRELGFAKAYALKGGWGAWVKAGYPVEIK